MEGPLPDDGAAREDAIKASELASDTLGRDLLSALVDELRLSPVWHDLSQERQDQTIERLRLRIQSLVAETLLILFGGRFPAIPGILSAVNFRKGIRATVDISRAAHHRHELTDFLNMPLVLVLGNPDSYLARMTEIKAEEQQADMFAPMASGVAFGQGYTGGDGKPYERGSDGDDAGIEPLEHAAGEPLWKQAQRAATRMGVEVDDETAQGWNEEQCTEVAYWTSVAIDNPGRPVPRPKFLPPAAEMREG